MNINNNIIITGSSGLVGSALKDLLIRKGYTKVFSIRSSECDLRDFNTTLKLFKEINPDYVFHTAGLVYGILGNINNKASSFYNNLLINTNVIEASHRVSIKKILCMGTGAVYPYPPKSMPYKEDEMWFGLPHNSEDSYAQAKRTMLAQLFAYNESYNLDFSYIISCNLFGPNDRFNINDGHVVPSLIHKFVDAKRSNKPVNIWGTGVATRDFLFSYDVARVLLTIMNKFSGVINIGSGIETSINYIVNCLCDISGHSLITWDKTKPDGQSKRIYDLSRLNKLGFKTDYSIKSGLSFTYNWFLENEKNIRV